jgi:hypothetical protein
MKRIRFSVRYDPNGYRHAAPRMARPVITQPSDNRYSHKKIAGFPGTLQTVQRTRACMEVRAVANGGREMLRQFQGINASRGARDAASRSLHDESRTAVSRTRRLFFVASHLLLPIAGGDDGQVVHPVVTAVWSRCGARSGRTPARA